MALRITKNLLCAAWCLTVFVVQIQTETLPNQPCPVSTRASFAQDSTSKVEQYCQIIASPGLFSNRVTIDIDFGEEKSIWRDNRLKAYDGRLKKFNTVIDALNYMGRDGWIFMNAYPVSIGSGVIYHLPSKRNSRYQMFSSNV